jgi:hypothetical protein
LSGRIIIDAAQLTAGPIWATASHRSIPAGRDRTDCQS